MGMTVFQKGGFCSRRRGVKPSFMGFKKQEKREGRKENRL
jgi:hypothetical protein